MDSLTSLDPRLPADQRGRWEGLRIHRYVAPSGWIEALAAIPDDEHRRHAEAYLREIAARMRTAAAVRRRRSW